MPATNKQAVLSLVLGYYIQPRARETGTSVRSVVPVVHSPRSTLHAQTRSLAVLAASTISTAHAGGRLAFERGDRRLFFYKSDFFFGENFLSPHIVYIVYTTNQLIRPSPLLSPPLRPCL